HLPGAFTERVEVHGAAEQLRALGRHLPDPAEGDEDRAPPQRHDEPEGARRLGARDRPDDNVADTADGPAVAVEQRPPGGASREHMGLRISGASLYSRGRGHPTIICTTASSCG